MTRVDKAKHKKVYWHSNLVHKNHTLEKSNYIPKALLTLKKTFTLL